MSYQNSDPFILYCIAIICLGENFVSLDALLQSSNFGSSFSVLIIFAYFGCNFQNFAEKKITFQNTEHILCIGQLDITRSLLWHLTKIKITKLRDENCNKIQSVGYLQRDTSVSMAIVGDTLVAMAIINPWWLATAAIKISDCH